METVTVFWASVWNANCDSRSMITARTREELWTKIADGQNRGVLSSVYETGTREDLDPDQLHAEMAEAERRLRTSCPLPPESDLLLLRDAKRREACRASAFSIVQGSEIIGLHRTPGAAARSPGF